MTAATGISTRMRLLGDRVVVQTTGCEEMTKSGIVLPETAAEKSQEGSIIAVGPVPCWRCPQGHPSGHDRRTT